MANPDDPQPPLAPWITPTEQPATSQTPEQPPLAPWVAASQPASIAPAPDAETPPLAPWLPQPEAQPPSFFGQLGQSFEAGLTDYSKLGYTAKALYQKATGNEQGMRDTMDYVSQLQDQQKALKPKYSGVGDIPALIENGSAGDAARWVADFVGESIPDVAMLATGFGAGGWLGKKLGMAVAEGALDEAAANMIVSKFARRSALTGGYLAATAQSTSDITQEQYQATGTLHPGVALAGGALAAIPAVVSPMALGAKFGLPESLASKFAETISSSVADTLGGGFLARRAGGALAYGLEGAIGSAGQAAVEAGARAFVDQNYKLLSPETAQRIMEAAAGGGLLSGAIGGVLPSEGMHYDASLSDRLQRAFGLRGFIPPELRGLTEEYTPPDDPRIMKILPESANSAVEQVLQAIRENIVKDGGFDKMHPDLRKQLESTTQTVEMLKPLLAKITKDVSDHLMMTDPTNMKDDAGNPMPVWTDEKVDLKNNEFKLLNDDPGGNGIIQEKTIPLSDIPMREITNAALEYFRSRGMPTSEVLSRAWDIVLNAAHADVVAQSHGQYANRIGYYADSNVTDRKGNVVDLTKGLQPGQVVFARDMGQDLALDRSQRRVYESLIKRFAPGAKVIIDLSESGFKGVPQAEPTRGGFVNWGDNNYAIRLPPARIPDDTTIFHELSHLIAWHRFGQLSIGEQMALYNLYRNTMKDDSTDGALLDIIRQVGTPDLQQYVSPGGHWNIPDMKKWWDFDEFIAEQGARYFLDTHSGMVNKYFNGLANSMHELLDAVHKTTGVALGPHEAIAGWFDSMYRRPPVGPQTLMEGVLRSSEENARAMGVRLDPADTLADRIAKAPPGASENIPLEAAVSAGHITPAIKAQADKFSWFTRWMWNTFQLAKLNPHIEPLRRASELFGLFHADRMTTAIRADGILKMQRKLGKVASSKLDKLEYTLDTMPYLSKGEGSRWPTPAEFRDQLNKLNIDPKTSEGRGILDVYTQKRQMYADVLDRIQEAAVKKAMEITDPAGQRAKLIEIGSEMGALRNKPYFPHSRYGDYAVSVRDSKGKMMHYSMYWTQRLAQDAGKDLIAEHKMKDPGAKYTIDKIPHEVRQWMGLPGAMLNTLRGMTDITPEQQSWIDNFIFDQSPANSFVQRMKKRSGLPGYDMNSARSFASYFSSASGHLARLKYGDDIRSSVRDLYASAKTDFGPTDIANRAQRTEMADWLSRESEYVMHPPNEHAAIRAFAFQWWLGLNPSTAFVHLMQMPMFTAPYMSKVYGMGSVPRMLQAYAEMRGLYRVDAHRPTGGLEPEYIKAQELLKHQGVLSENRGTDMAAWADRGLMSRSLQGTSIQRFMQEASNWSGQIMRLVEQNNRLVTARAIWKEAMRDPQNKYVQKLIAENDLMYKGLLGEGWRPEAAGAFLAARDGIQQTHFQYTQVARPRWQRGIASPVMTFMMYKQQALWFFMHNPAGLRSLAALTAISGVSGLPFEQDISNLIKMVSEWAGTRFDPNAELRKIANELTEHPEVIMHGFGRSGLGIPHLFNMLGLPSPIGDVSRRLGYGEEFPGVSEFTRDQKENFMERFGNTVTGMAGASAEVPISFGNIMQNLNVPRTLHKLLEPGNIAANLRGLEPVMPSILRNIDMASRYIAQGGDVSTRGAMRVPMDMTDNEGRNQAFARLLGFASPEVARMQEYEDELRQVNAYWTLRRMNVMSDFVQSRITGDKQGIEDTLAGIKQYNGAVPEPKYRIRAQSLIEAMKRRREGNLMEQRGMVPSGLQRSILPDYPEVQQQLQQSGTQSSPPQ